MSIAKNYGALIQFLLFILQPLLFLLISDIELPGVATYAYMLVFKLVFTVATLLLVIAPVSKRVKKKMFGSLEAKDKAGPETLLRNFIPYVRKFIFISPIFSAIEAALFILIFDLNSSYMIMVEILCYLVAGVPSLIATYYTVNKKHQKMISMS